MGSTLGSSVFATGAPTLASITGSGLGSSTLGFSSTGLGDSTLTSSAFGSGLADFFGFKDRGRIVVGHHADLVLLDPEKVLDQANLKNSKALSTGIEMVWVNGILVYQNQSSTGLQPGRLIKRND